MNILVSGSGNFGMTALTSVHAHICLLISILHCLRCINPSVYIFAQFYQMQLDSTEASCQRFSNVRRRRIKIVNTVGSRQPNVCHKSRTSQVEPWTYPTQEKITCAKPSAQYAGNHAPSIQLLCNPISIPKTVTVGDRDVGRGGGGCGSDRSPFGKFIY